MAAKRVIIVGGGFAGVQCAKRLRKLLPAGEVEVVVFSRENHMVFAPLLAEACTAALPPKDVATPLRQLLKGVKCRSEEVLQLDLKNNRIEYLSDDAQRRSILYDHLVVAAGNIVNLGMVPGMQDHAFAMKTMGDAMLLQGHVIDQLERAEVCENRERKRWYLSFVVVGGGFSGVEVAGELNDLVRNSRRFYQNIAREDITVTLIHSRDQILPEVSPSLREFARRELEKAGVNVVLNASAAICTAEGVGLADGRFCRGATVVCTIGTRPLPLIERLDLPKERGRLVTEPDMSLPGYDNAWAIGDCAAVVNAADGRMSPPTGQFAERQGAQVAANIAARIAGRDTKPFFHKSLGSLCAIGGRNAVAEMLGLRMAGFLAWFVWRGVYLFKIPSLAQQMKVGMEWMCELIFPRGLANLRIDVTDRVSHGYYAPGEFIFREGDPALNFFTISDGEVEVLLPIGAEGQYETIAVLGPGDFFGESALLENHRSRKHAVRARTKVEVVIMGSNIFTRLSAALQPLRDAVAESAKRRRSIWDKLPQVRAILDQIPLDQHIEPLPTDTLKPDSRIREAVHRMNVHRTDACFVVDENSQLTGVVTRSDLMKAMEVAATLPPEKHIGMTVSAIMTADPIAATQADSTTIAVSTMREHNLVKMPVVRSSADRTVIGYLRAENIMDTVVKRLIAEEDLADATTSDQAR